MPADKFELAKADAGVRVNPYHDITSFQVNSSLKRSRRRASLAVHCTRIAKQLASSFRSSQPLVPSHRDWRLSISLPSIAR